MARRLLPRRGPRPRRGVDPGHARGRGTLSARRELPAALRRNPTNLRSQGSFDHVGRDAGSRGLVVGDVLADLADDDVRIVAACADLKYVTRMAVFEARHPDRFF